MTIIKYFVLKRIVSYEHSLIIYIIFMISDTNFIIELLRYCNLI